MTASRFKINFVLTLFMAFVISGCATNKSEVKPELGLVIPEVKESETMTPEIQEVVVEAVSEPEEVVESQVDEAIVQKGIIFAKSVFEGILKTSYVKLHFKGVGDNTHEFDLIIGEKERQSVLPWDVKTVEPGYFYVELPAGKYKITNIAIPVGSTLAEEIIDIDVEVLAMEITYVGTLKVIGTKERIKLGGVPVIRPGFEYVAEVIDEQEEGFTIFRNRYPQFNKQFQVQLLKIYEHHDRSFPAK